MSGMLQAVFARQVQMDEQAKALKSPPVTVQAAKEDPLTNLMASLGAKPYIDLQAAPPIAEPPSRGGAPQEEDMTNRAKENTKTLKQPASMEHMKRGPKELTKEVARSAPEANEGEKALLENVGKLESEIDSLKAQIASATETLNKSMTESKKSLVTTLTTLYDLMENNGRRVTRFKDEIIAIDSKRDIKSANLSPQAVKKAEEINAKISRKLEEVKGLKEELSELNEEQFKKYGGVETEQPRVTTAPNPDMKAGFGLKRVSCLLAAGPCPSRAFTEESVVFLRAGIIEVLKGFWTKLKSVFSGFDEIETDLQEYAGMVA